MISEELSTGVETAWFTVELQVDSRDDFQRIQ